jgi:hypothetical protein
VEKVPNLGWFSPTWRIWNYINSIHYTNLERSELIVPDSSNPHYLGMYSRLALWSPIWPKIPPYPHKWSPHNVWSRSDRLFLGAPSVSILEWSCLCRGDTAYKEILFTWRSTTNR